MQLIQSLFRQNYEAYIGSCRRFGTTYPSHIQDLGSPKSRLITTYLRCVTFQNGDDIKRKLFVQ